MAQAEKRRLGGFILPRMTAPANPPTGNETVYVDSAGVLRLRAATGTDAAVAMDGHTHAASYTTAPAVGLSFTTTNTEGASSSVARADHTHAITAFDATAPVSLTPDTAAAVGTATTAARRDHRHLVAAAAPTTALSSTTTNAEGTGTSFARNDHTHAVTFFDTTPPATVSPDTAAAVGTAPVAARRDHVHGIAVGTPVTINITEPALNPGVANSVARSDHVHTATGFVGLSQFDWADYTPTLTNGSTNVPKNVVSARYIWIGDLIIAVVRLNVTGAGVAGDIRVGLPVSTVLNDLMIGQAAHYDASANTAYNGVAYSSGSAIYFVRDGTVSNVAHNVAMGNGDVVWMNVQYEP